MDINYWRTAQGQEQIPGQVIGGEAVPVGGMEGGDWRTQLQQDSRQRIVNKIMETLKRHLPFSGQEGLQELKKIAVRFEEKIYTAAISQSDYLRKISLKMLTMETKSQNPMANSIQSNAASNGENPQDPGNETSVAISICPDKMLTMETESKNPMANSLLSNAASDSKNPQDPGCEIQNEIQQLSSGVAANSPPPSAVLVPNVPNMQNMSPNAVVVSPMLPGQLQQQRRIQSALHLQNQLLQSQKLMMGRNRPFSLFQQGQFPQQLHMNAKQQPQMSQTHMNEGQMNSQMQPLNIPLCSMMPTQQNNMPSLLRNTLFSGSTVSNSNSCQNMQPGSTIDLGQGNALNPMLLQQKLGGGGSQQMTSSLSSQKQNGMTAPQSNVDFMKQPLREQQLLMQRQQLLFQQTNSLQQNPVGGGSQQTTSPISSQNGLTAVQSIVNNSLQSNSSILPQHQMKQQYPQQQQQMLQQCMQRQQLIEQQQFQQWQMLQQLIQQRQQQTSQKQSGQQMMQTTASLAVVFVLLLVFVWMTSLYEEVLRA